MTSVRMGKSQSRAVLAVAWAILCGWPYVRWFANPSLFYDDFARVGSLRRATLGEALFRPFNEHMAPLFELVSWLAWQGVGRQVLAIPMGFMVASYVAFGVTAAVLAMVIHREIRSSTTTLVTLTFFLLSSVSAETVLLYSASSFQWAASASLAAWLAASMAVDARSRWGQAGWLAASAAFSSCAPAFCAIGMLAGPLAMLRILSNVAEPLPILRRLGWSILPPLGTVGFLILCEHFRYREVLSASVQHQFEPLSALWAMLRAPTNVLIPALFGLPGPGRIVSEPILAGLTVIGLVGSGFWAVRSPRRPLILGGLAFIVTGYLSAYATRAAPDNVYILAVQRYHLFPQIGLIFLVAALTAPRWKRLDASPGWGLILAVCLASLLSVSQYPRMRAVSDERYRYPDQPRALAAASRLEAVCDREGITLGQSIVALEPIQTRWYPRESPFNPLLLLFPPGPASSPVPDASVRQILIDSMSSDDREVFFGGMEATRYRLPASTWAGSKSPIEARLIEGFRMVSLGEARYRAEGGMSYLEYEVGTETDQARALSLGGLRASQPLEITWADKDGAWSAYRRVRWIKDPQHPESESAVSLDVMPHWRRGHVRRFRVVFRETGPVALKSARFWP